MPRLAIVSLGSREVGAPPASVSRPRRRVSLGGSPSTAVARDGFVSALGAGNEQQKNASVGELGGDQNVVVHPDANSGNSHFTNPIITRTYITVPQQTVEQGDDSAAPAPPKSKPKRPPQPAAYLTVNGHGELTTSVSDRVVKTASVGFDACSFISGEVRRRWRNDKCSASHQLSLNI